MIMYALKHVPFDLIEDNFRMGWLISFSERRYATPSLRRGDVLDLQVQDTGGIMTCPRCRCPECKAAAVNAVLGKIVSRETIPVEEINAATLQDNRAKDEWRDIIGETDSIDPHATDLALAVAEEMQRGRG